MLTDLHINPVKAYFLVHTRPDCSTTSFTAINHVCGTMWGVSSAIKLAKLFAQIHRGTDVTLKVKVHILRFMPKPDIRIKLWWIIGCRVQMWMNQAARLRSLVAKTAVLQMATRGRLQKRVTNQGSPLYSRNTNVYSLMQKCLFPPTAYSPVHDCHSFTSSLGHRQWPTLCSVTWKPSSVTVQMCKKPGTMHTDQLQH